MSLMREPEDPLDAARGCFNALMMTTVIFAMTYLFWRIFS